MSHPVLEVRHVTKRFPQRGGPDFVAVDDVSFTLARGGSLAVVGESGSGKTTIARIICGLESATSGTVLVDGEPRTASNTAQARQLRAKQVQMVFQDPFSSLDPRQTGFRALEEILRVHTDQSAQSRAEAIATLGEQVGLGEKELGATPRRLSGGQRQRLAIARALAVEPDVLLLDESVSALDVSVQAQILNLLVELRRARGLSYLFVSHDLAVVRQISEDVIVLRKGQVLEAGATSEVLANPQADYTRLLRESVPRPGWHPRRRTQGQRGTGAL